MEPTPERDDNYGSTLSSDEGNPEEENNLGEKLKRQLAELDEIVDRMRGAEATYDSFIVIDEIYSALMRLNSNLERFEP